ncbi:AsnC family transcriptional regulator [Candidatus Hecatella orcuttiae]|jgi:DNA-binding Lrp family transcriptional regulator|uniref:siroheme decarboxylase subunit alpha n=1 Tax=Candidatus Hecatella orcuttiae TaxID=1935119 RepID=UPI002867E5DB|nr:AsnC family transcriptional regulator [Candidatus Hecatella orcuttiae]
MVTLDKTDRKLLQLVQDDFPLVEKPWAEVAAKLGVGEEEAIRRVKRLLREGVISRIGPIIDARKVGLKASTLVAVKVAEGEVERVARIINGFKEVSHNYERDNAYNLWFTVTARDEEELEKVLKKIKRKTGIREDDFLELRSQRVFKIGLKFNFTE